MVHFCLETPIESCLVLVRLPKQLVRLSLIDVRPHHFKLLDNLHSLSDIELEGFEALVNEYLTFLCNLILGDTV